MSIVKKGFKVACVQTKASQNFNRNLKRAIALAHEAGKQRPDLIAFPEMFLYRGDSARYSAIAAESKRAIHKFQFIAKLSGISILLGSVLECSSRKNQFYNTSFLISKTGAILAKYRKIHLFDVRTPKNVLIQESKLIRPGNRLVLANEKGVCFGFSICFDVRFPEHFRALAMRGAQVFFVPSNFLLETGEAHWNSLLRARAIENQTFVIAPAQAGINPDSGRRSYGHSLIVGPWGEVLAEASESREEVILANLDLNAQSNLRKQFPVLDKKL